MSLEDYLAQRTRDYPALKTRAVWEIEDLPETITAENFWYQVCGDVRDVGRQLCGKLIEFCLKFVERTVDFLTQTNRRVPTPEQIAGQINATAQAEAENPRHEIWMYAAAMENPVVEAAASNAINNRWADPVQQRQGQPETPERAASVPSKTSGRRGSSR